MNHFNNKSQRILVEKWQNEGNRAALDLLASSNQNIVRREAWKLSRGNTGIDVEDLIQEGMMGISIAANKYDSSKSPIFIAYAMTWVKKFMKRFIVENRSIVKLGKTNDSRIIFSSMAKVISENKLEDVTEEEKVVAISEELSVCKQEVYRIRNMLSSNDKRIDVFSESRDRELVDSSFPDENHHDFEKRQMLNYFSDKINYIVENEMTNEDKEILYGRLLGEEKISLEEIADKIGMTRQTVKNREHKLVDFLRKRLNFHFKITKADFF